MLYTVGEFTRKTVSGYNEGEAFSKLPFMVVGSATQAFNKWKENYEHPMNEMAENQFMLDYLAKMSKNAPGVGYSILIDKPHQDTRVRPWKFTSIPGYKRLTRRKLEDVIQVIGYDKEGHTFLLGELKGHYKDAMKVARQAFVDGFKGHIEGRHIYRVPQDCVELCFAADYAPSKFANEGIWICFGIVNKPIVEKEEE